ncbi:MAG: DUF4352 domain-containing protein [Lachnospiraceae bacterium]|nr:DUF4352 domain-containing protein [Lachnospiraceae bacterium]
MRRIVLLFATVLFVSFLYGCGDKNPLTEEESSLIAEYAAHTVLQGDPGYERRLIMPVSADASADASSEAGEDTEATTEAVATTESLAEATTESNSSDGGSGDPGNSPSGDNTGSNSNGGPGVPTANVSKDLSTAFSKLNLKATYNGYYFTKKYGDKNASSADITPINGGQLLIVKVKLKNTGKDTKTVNMLDYNYRYSVTLDTGTTYSLLTVLDDDISVFQGSIKAGKSRNVVAIFEVPQGINKPSNGATFNVSNGQSETSVALQ